MQLFNCLTLLISDALCVRKRSFDHFLSSDRCSPIIKLFPQPPFQLRRNEDFYVTSHIHFNCTENSSTSTTWIVSSCPSTCSEEAQLNQSIETANNDLFIPAQTLNYGRYELKLTVTPIALPALTTTSLVHIEIFPTGIITNLLPFVMSKITHHYRQDLILNPGKYSIDLNAITFDSTVSDWTLNQINQIFGLLELVLLILLSNLWSGKSSVVHTLRRCRSPMLCQSIKYHSIYSFHFESFSFEICGNTMIQSTLQSRSSPNHYKSITPITWWFNSPIS